MSELQKEEGFTPKRFSRGEVVEGVVLKKGRDMLLLDIGAKTEGIVSGDELDDGLGTFDNVAPGDSVLATVIQGGGENGAIVLSLKEAVHERGWRELEGSYERGEPITVTVTGFNRGGLMVDAGIPAFLPLSQLDPSHFPVREEHRAHGGSSEIREILSDLIDKELLVKIIEFEPQNNRLVVSEKQALSQTAEDDELWRDLEVGSKVSGVVTGVAPFGLFVCLEGTSVEGLVHLSEISWSKVTHPAELYKIGDQVEAEVLAVDPRKGKISLSLKNLKENPWEKIGERYKVGDIVEVEVIKITPFGAFVKLEEDVEGLIHVSETVGPLEVGEHVRAKIVELKPEEQRLGLSVRDLEAN